MEGFQHLVLKNGEVDVNSLNISNDTIFDLEDNLLLFLLVCQEVQVQF